MNHCFSNLKIIEIVCNFRGKSIMLSDGLWEDLEIERISLPSLPFQLQFPNSGTIPLHCEDEADLFPGLHLDSDFELTLDQQHLDILPDDILGDPLSRYIWQLISLNSQ